MANVGCLQLPGGSENTDTEENTKDTETRTQAQGLGTIEFSVTNQDDVTHRLEVKMENAEGRIVLETNEPELEPGITVSSGSAGEPPENSPFTISFRTDSASAEYVWDIEECERINLTVIITVQGEITIERDLCQN